jgi:uncharacterized protein with PIN domain
VIPQQKSAYFRFYEELNDFLSKNLRKETFLYRFWGNPAVKDAIEAIGVPHTEIEIILVNGVSVGFDYHLQHEDRVSVYPVFESLDVTPLVRLRPLPLRRTCFILDVHLGKLARLLRMLGFDTLYQKDYSDNEIRTLAGKEQRIILTRDQDLLKVKNVTHGYWLRSTQPPQQIVEIVKRFDLKSQVRPFTRCLDCNGLIKKVNPEEPGLEVPVHAKTYYQEFYMCGLCKKIYWQGSHYQKMNDIIARIISD